MDTIREMNRKEVDLAIEWAAAEGWNPGLHDAMCYYKADPNGFLIGLRGDEPVATISAVNYGEGFGFIGFYIVKPEHRGKGYGMQIWKAGMSHLQGLNIGLDGVVAQQENYKKSGFTLAYRNIRFEGVGGENYAADHEEIDLCSLSFETTDCYDQPFFPAKRSAFVRSWISQPGSRALGIMKHDKLAGYGVIRRCRSGCKIAPLFADTPQLAEALFQALQSKAEPGEPVFLDVPEVNQAAVSLADRCKMNVSFETARMYTGEAPELPFHRIYGVASFEIG